MRQRRRLLLLGIVCTMSAGFEASPDNPRTWPERFNEGYHFQRQALGQLTFSWEDLKARRFFLVLDAQGPFQATLVRDRDAQMLFAGRRASHYETLIDWGRGELAQLTVSSARDSGLDLTVRISTDPREEGLEIHSFQVNRFLRFYEEKDWKRARACLRAALSEDANDSTAMFLQRKLDESKDHQEGGTDNQP